MAVVTRYFSTSGAGAADGTTWADRAALFSAGDWSSVITGFAFNGSDSMRVLIGPGTYSCSQALASGLFGNAPTANNPLILHGCDGSGVILAPSNPDWTSDTPVDWDTPLPVIATTTNISTINLAAGHVRLVKFTASGATTAAPLNVAASIDWCVLLHSGSHTSAVGCSATKISNTSVEMSGSSYRAAYTWAGNTLTNIRGKGVTGSSGNRHGIEFVGATTNSPVDRATIYEFGGDGIGSSSATATHFFVLVRSVIANNGGTGVKANSTASQTAYHRIAGCIVTGNGVAGIDAQTNANVIASGNRLRDNTGSNLANFSNYPTDMDNYTTDSDDSTEYVDASNGDFRIRNSATIWGGGYGVSDQAATTTSGAALIFDGTVVR